MTNTVRVQDSHGGACPLLYLLLRRAHFEEQPCPKVGWGPRPSRDTVRPGRQPDRNQRRQGLWAYYALGTLSGSALQQ